MPAFRRLFQRKDFPVPEVFGSFKDSYKTRPYNASPLTAELRHLPIQVS
jgi:hypothetical protein